VSRSIDPGIWAVLSAALLFGAGTPIAKHILHDVDAWTLAGLLYLGSGVGLALWRVLTRAVPVRLPRSEVGWLATAILAGGVAGPVLLLLGLSRTPASGASLLLNAEGVFTALIAWFVFRENFDRRIAVGMALIAAGALWLSWSPGAELAQFWPAAAILGACLCWGIDNNLTRKVSLADATWIAMIKGIVAGSINLALSRGAGGHWPAPRVIGLAAIVGLLAYGISLVLFVIGLRRLGTARTGAYFSIAPFFGALLAITAGEAVTIQLVGAGLLMAAGVWLHVSERHVHEHVHEALEHEHEHSHDEHHQHEHPDGSAPEAGVRHTHWHRHAPLKHSHGHFPDAHHLHSH